MTKPLIFISSSSKAGPESTVRDGIFSLVYYVYLLVFLYGFGYIMFKTNLIEKFSIPFQEPSLFKLQIYIPVSLLQLIPVLFLLYIRGQSFKTIGVSGKNRLNSLWIGLAAAIPFSLPQLYGLVAGTSRFSFQGIGLVWECIYYLLCIAFTEEVIFRGYLQSRVKALVNNKYMALLLTAFMFAAMHIPFQMMKGEGDPLAFIVNDWPHLLITAILHIYFYLIYTRTGNILGPTIAHGVQDILQTFIQ